MATRKTPESKAIDAIMAMVEQRDYSPNHFAYLMLTDHNLSDVIPLALALIEWAALKTNHGEFTDEDRGWQECARVGRKAMLDYIERLNRLDSPPSMR